MKQAQCRIIVVKTGAGELENIQAESGCLFTNNRSLNTLSDRSLANKQPDSKANERERKELHIYRVFESFECLVEHKQQLAPTGQAVNSRNLALSQSLWHDKINLAIVVMDTKTFRQAVFIKPNWDVLGLRHLSNWDVWELGRFGRNVPVRF